ncbi:MAG: CDP-diacylglycerol--glycerol-3-phosphate 3-phosphatidyltransferase [Verrucomicrobia bacterium]|nr:CDP-diacylglycerol--glycerol-3-phosphate 3-phosphatidyltransferase [Verrucomicrobiota bacterium]
MNLPNKLTLMRFGITTGFAALLESHWPFSCTGALLLFGLASFTDYADGAIARRYNLITDFGTLMDPLVDKILAATALICLAARDYNGRSAIPAWVAIVIVSREFLITGLRQLAAAKGVVLPADRFGKHKTIWQIITILYFLLLLSLNEWVLAGWLKQPGYVGLLWSPVGSLLLGLALVLTVGSGLGYLWRNRALIEDR